ncbi:MAG TPA: EamA family transporter, partial [Burkholderiaceae bacterium]|nr:EamA family transporter [Burkholderiaceae bacterium]
MNRAIELSLLGLLALLWGSSYVLIKLALASFPPLTLIAIRVTVASVLLLAAMRLRHERFPRDGATWRGLVVQAFFNSVGAWTVLAWGQQHVDSGLAGVLNSTSPLFVFLLTLLWTRHEPVTVRKTVGALLGFAGVVLVLGVDALTGIGRQVMAQLAVLLGAVLYAFAALNGRRFSSLPPTVTAAATMLCATFWLIPVSLVADQPWNLRPTVGSLTAALALGVFCTALALLLYFRLLRTLGPIGVTSQSYLRCGISVLLGVLVLGEHVTATIGFGLLAIVLGVAAINTPKK